MHENDLSFYVRKAIFRVFNGLGPGLFESVYAKALCKELSEMGLKVRDEVALPFIYNETPMQAGFRIDIIVEDKVIIEVKSVDALGEIHHKQLLTYLKLSGKKLGLLVNFNTSDITTSIIRKVNNL